MAEKGDVKKIIIGGDSYNVFDEGARTKISSLETAVSKKADASALSSYVTTTAADGKYETKTNVSALSTKVTNLTTATNAAFKGAKYDSSKKQIIFTPISGTEVSIDASDFIKDGMVDTVTIGEAVPSGATDSTKKTCLIITFNQAAGKEAINLEISKIFNADNYYTKEQTDKKISDATNGIATETNVKSWIATAKKEATDYTDSKMEEIDLAFFQSGVNDLVYFDSNDTSGRRFLTSVVNDQFSIVKKNAAGEIKAGALIDLSDGKQGTLAYTSDIPTKVSALTNDAGFVNSLYAEYNESEKSLTLGVAYQVAPK